MENRPMTNEERAQYEGVLTGIVLDTDEFKSRLVLLDDRREHYARRLEAAGRNGEAFQVRAGPAYTLMGDLRGAFDSPELMTAETEESGAWGNYDAEAKIKAAPGFEAFEGLVSFEPEGATFFAYAKDETVGRDFLEFVRNLVRTRRQEVTA